MTPRHAGVILPLFSAASSRSWGIGEIPDLAPLCTWLASAGFDRLMLLPLGTLPAGETSPYSARSAMSIDPVYIGIDALDDFHHAGGLDALSADARVALDEARRSTRVDYAAVRHAKTAALDQAFAWFYAREWAALTTRGGSLAGYIARERWWLDDYALFQAISEDEGGRPWTTWPPALRDREPRALAEARRRLAPEVLRHQYWQWIADQQWQAARAHAHHAGVAIVGDLPFVTTGDGPDVWARADQVDLDVSLGVPPDAFSDTGQDWGLPTYRWDAIARTNYAWLRARARRMTSLFDAIRLDHLVGFFRTFGRPKNGATPAFRPADEAAQRQQGEAVLRIFLETGLDVIAEDLGVIPDFVRATLAHLGVPGCKVLRWERAWHDEGTPFVEPSSFPARSAALTGTHDTTPLALWWDTADIGERRDWIKLPRIARDVHDPAEPWSDRLRDASLALAFDAGSEHLFIPFGDVFGWRDRINTPATVGEGNWTWRLPWPVDALEQTGDAVARARWCRGAAVRSRRLATTSARD